MQLTSPRRAFGSVTFTWDVYRRRPVVFLMIGLLAILLSATAVCGAEIATQPAAQGQSAQKTLLIATKETPPFAMKNNNGHWDGLTIELWRDIAQDLGLKFTFEETTLHDALEGVANHTYDAAVAAITITSEREKTLDFTQPYFITGLGIAVPNQQQRGWVQAMRQFASMAFLKTVLGLVALLLFAGLLVWFFERRHNAPQFGEGPGKGVLAGFWWAAVTMTTVGYGDKAPATTGGRLVAIVWMFASIIIIISGFTAAIASSLTLGQLQSQVNGPDDLSRVRVGAVEGSTSSEYLLDRHMSYVAYDSSTKALEALNNGKIDAVLYDAPILRYQIKQQYEDGLRVLPGIFYQQYYGIALPQGSPYREQINQRLLIRINDRPWRDEVVRYLGK